MVEMLRPLGQGSVRLETQGERRATILVENAGRKNAFSGKMMAELHDAVQQLQDSAFNHTTTLFVQGTSDFFCSGADLSVLGAFSKEDGLRMSALMQETLQELRGLPQISVAVVNGGAMGGGTELALSCDFRVMASDAKFRMVHTTLGLVPGWGGGARLVQLLGRRQALQVLSGAPKLSAQDCLEIGLADQVSSKGEDAFQTAEKFMSRFETNVLYPSAVRDTKRLIDRADCGPEMHAWLDYEKALFAQAWQGEENADALQRIAQRRAARKP